MTTPPETQSRDSQHDPVVGRLAPSPTGGLHLGHARTFFIAWLAARQVGGRVVLRIEDIDSSRVRPGMTEQAIIDLRWLGLEWDEGPDVGGPSSPYLQSLRTEYYVDALEKLKHANLIYPCTCTRSEIQRIASAPHQGEDGPIYPGTCAKRSADDVKALGDRGFSWRFRVENVVLAWNDLLLGPIQSNPATAVGDFIVGRSDGVPSYQLAVVVDDAAMGINQVIRGDDLVSSTPKQLALYKALELKPPRFGHVPLVYDRSGKRLAKRDGSIKLSNLRAQYLEPERLHRWLAESIGIDPTKFALPADWIGTFDLEHHTLEPIFLDMSLFNSGVLPESK